MNETTSGPTGSQDNGPHESPWGEDRREQARNLDRLRRSSTDQYVAGVAGGLGRHFGVDPTILRVLFVVLTFFGGAGLLVYAAIWLLVPDDTQEKAPIQVAAEPRKLLLLGVLGIAFLLAVGDAFGGFGGGWVFASIAIVVALVLILRDRSRDRSRDQDRPPAAYPPPMPPSATEPTAPTAASSGGAITETIQPMTYPSTSQYATQQPPPPTWQGPPAPPTPPVPPRPIVPPRPKRTGVIWFWPTLALIAIGLGVLGMIDSGSTDLPAGAYPALAVAITGVMLIVGSLTGRPGGLILIGAVATFALSVSTVLGSFSPNARSITATPTSAAVVQPSYSAGAGRIEVDLTQLSDPEALAGREIDVSLRAGEIVVIVPRSLNVDIDAEIRFAGGIRIPGYDAGAFGRQVERAVAAVPASTAAPLELDLELRVGQITVEHR